MTALRFAGQPLEDAPQLARRLPEHRQDAARQAKLPRDESEPLRPEPLEEVR
jgi:hypothetical protein